MRLFHGLLGSAGAFALLSGCSSDTTETSQPQEDQVAVSNGTASDEDLIRNAMSVAPEAISREASVVVRNLDGSTRTLRPGTNGWTCMPDRPRTPGTDPMCMDQASMRWAQALRNKQAPPRDATGISYMSAGNDANNVNPHAQQPEPGDQRIESAGPRLMIVGIPVEQLKSYPSGRNPDTTKPYVMWGGTEYAHLMVPVR